MKIQDLRVLNLKEIINRQIPENPLPLICRAANRSRVSVECQSSNDRHIDQCINR